MERRDNNNDPARLVDFAVLGEREENVSNVLAIIGNGSHAVQPLTNAGTCLEGVHAKRRQIPQAVRWWLTNRGKGAKCAREMAIKVCYPLAALEISNL